MRYIILACTLIAVLALACDGGNGDGGGGEGDRGSPTSTAGPPAEELQRDIVARFIDDSTMVRVACLDGNGDGSVDAADAATLIDISGDTVVDEDDLAVVREVTITLAEGRPAGCEEGQPDPDWQVSSPVAAGCSGSAGGLVLFAIGGGAVELSNPTNSAGARWMIVEVGKVLEGARIPYQLISVNPGLVGTTRPQPHAEEWALAYLRTLLTREPCLLVVLLGHSHGGVHVTATASRLEEADLSDRILLTVVVDRVTHFYAGDNESIPELSPVLNLVQTNEDIYQIRPIVQPNIENIDVSGETAPERGELGGEPEPVNHTTMDNSPGVLAIIIERIMANACARGLC